MDYEGLTGKESHVQTRFSFKSDLATSSSDFPEVRISFSLFHQSRRLDFQGIRTKPIEALSKAELRARTASWERTASIPLPSNGIQTKEARQIIETRPADSWDVTGLWELTEGRPNKTLGLPDISRMSLILYMANNPQHVETGRQFWAKFEFGKNKGLFRFRPSPSGDTGIEDDSMVFEETCNAHTFLKCCPLEESVWPGPSRRRWSIRMRAINYEMIFTKQFGEGPETMVVFSQLYDGRLSMNVELFFQNSFKTFTATKVSEVSCSGRELTINSEWERYKPKAKFGLDMYKDLLDEGTDEDEPQPAVNRQTSAVTPGTSNRGPKSRPSLPLFGPPASVKESSFWDVEGHYKINHVKNHRNLDTTHFSLRLCYSSTKADRSRQLYGIFSFDSLKGIMRMCPKSSGPKLSMTEFEAACNLDTKSRACVNNSHWDMRYRVKDGGLRLGKHVGGELNTPMPLSFRHNAKFSTQFSQLSI